MTDTRYIRLASLLIDIECELRRGNFWSAEPPSVKALASVEPFCVDTLELEQWLQYVFLPRMHTLLADRSPLPTQCNIAAIAETVWATNMSAKPVIAILQQFDEMISSLCA